MELSADEKDLLERIRQTQISRTERIRQMFIDVLPHQERNTKPTVPSEAAIRLQTRINAEEFVEKLSALYDDDAAIAQLRYLLKWFTERSSVRSDLHDRLPEFADALADCAVTNEGFAVAFGIDLQRVFDVVHASNMTKKGGPIVDGKLLKPDGWQPPDVAGELRRQGWTPSSEAEADEPIPYRVATIDVQVEASVDGKNWTKFGDNESILSCDLHGMIENGESECVRCENAQYNGNEIAAVLESFKERKQDEPISLLLPASTIFETIGVPQFSMVFATNDLSIIATYQEYMNVRAKVIPIPVNTRPYPVSVITKVEIGLAYPSDERLGYRNSVKIHFEKVI